MRSDRTRRNHFFLSQPSPPDKTEHHFHVLDAPTEWMRHNTGIMNDYMMTIDFRAGYQLMSKWIVFLNLTS